MRRGQLSRSLFCSTWRLSLFLLNPESILAPGESRKLKIRRRPSLAPFHVPVVRLGHLPGSQCFRDATRDPSMAQTHRSCGGWRPSKSTSEFRGPQGLKTPKDRSACGSCSGGTAAAARRRDAQKRSFCPRASWGHFFASSPEAGRGSHASCRLSC